MEIIMAWRNVWRNPKRTLLTIFAIAFACILLIFMLSMQFGTYEVMINSVVKNQTGHLQVYEQGYNEDQKLRRVVPHVTAIGELLDRIDKIVAYTYRANGFALLSSKHRTHGGMVTGIDPQRETRVSSAGTNIIRGEFLGAHDTNMAVIGSLLAKNLHVDVGDELVVLGSAVDGSIAATVLFVKGIFSSGMDGYDRSGIQIPLAHFKEVFAMGDAVHQVVILCDDLESVESIKKVIAANLPSTPKGKKLVCRSWDEIMPGLMQSIQMDLGGGIIFYGILIVIVAFSIMNTFIIAVFERTHEFGILLAMGAKPFRLTRMLLYESAFLTACGILLGVSIGCCLTLYARSCGIPLGGAEGMMAQYGIPSVIRPKLTLTTALAGPLVVFVITMLTALYPAVKVHGLNIVDAMKAT